MPSTAISAQGSVCSISTGSGGAKTISGTVVVGNPTILTATAHGFSNGDVVALAGLTGASASLLNGLSVVVQYKTTNTFAVAIDTSGATITAAGTATPNTYTAIANVQDFSGFDGSASEIDVTNLASVAKEFRLGLTDAGQLSLSINQDNADAGQLAVRAALVSGAVKNFKILLPSGVAASFAGFVKKFGASGGVDAVVKSSIDIRITGAVTWA